MSEMKSRVRYAIAKALDPLIEPGRTTTLNELAAGCARAAIEEMREPTGDMIVAGIKTHRQFPTQPSRTWRAMIDAALGREP